MLLCPVSVVLSSVRRRSVLCCAKGDVAMSTVLSVSSLTAVSYTHLTLPTTAEV